LYHLAGFIHNQLNKLFYCHDAFPCDKRAHIYVHQIQKVSKTSRGLVDVFEICEHFIFTWPFTGNFKFWQVNLGKKIYATKQAVKLVNPNALPDSCATCCNCDGILQ